MIDPYTTPTGDLSPAQRAVGAEPLAARATARRALRHCPQGEDLAEFMAAEEEAIKAILKAGEVL